MNQITPKKPYADICEKVRAMNPIVDFDTIKEGEYYHIPPFYYHKRCDILILEKKGHMLRCETINEGESYAHIEYLYKSTFELRFMTKYKNVPNSVKIRLSLPF